MNDTIPQLRVPNNDNLRDVAKMVGWLLQTVFWAAFMPYLLAGFGLGMAALAGMTNDDARVSLIALATFDKDAFAKIGQVWHVLAYLCMTCVFLWHVDRTDTIQINKRRIEASLQRWLLSKTAWTRSFDNDSWLVRILPNKATWFAFVVALATGAVIALAVLLSNNPQPRTEVKIVRPQALPPQTTAAISLADGTVRSGQASIIKQADDSYVLTFAK